MNKHDCYVVDGCVDFIPVKRSTLTSSGVEVTIVGSARKERVLVDKVCQMSKIFEPQKVVVPEFIGDLIKELKNGGCPVGEINENTYYDKVQEWIDDNEELFYRAWLDGYEVEKEKLYTVEIPDPNSMYKHRFLSRNDNGVCIDASNGNDWKQRRENHLTEAEIKQDFEWAWDAGFVKGVE